MKATLFLIGVLLTLTHLRADTIAQWNFNSPTPDNAATTGTLSPSVGQGTASVIGGVNSAFATGDTAAGHDPAGSTDNSGWQTSGYPVAGSGNLSAGVAFAVDTTGFANLSLIWYQRHSTTASRYFRLQYTVDGSTFTDGQVITIAPDSTFTAQTVDLTVVPGVDNNPLFGFRLVAEFESTAAGGAELFVATKSGSTYAGSGTVRFDMVTVLGTPIPGANTPPRISSLPNQVLRLGQTSGPLVFNVSDAEDPTERLAVSAISSDQAVVADGSITVSGTGANRFVSVRAGNQPGVATVTLTVSDPGARSASTQFTVEVLPANTAPTLSIMTRTNTLAGTPAVVLFQVADLETPSSLLQVSASSPTSALLPGTGIVVGSSGTNWSLTLTPASGQTGVAPVTVRVTDGEIETFAAFPLLVTASSSVLLDEPFAYPSGPVTNSALWSTRSGTAGQCLVQDGQLELSVARTEDVVAPLVGSPYVRSNGTVLYASFRLMATALPKARPGLLAHFADGSTLRGRVYVGTTNAAPGRFRVSVANGSDRVAELPADLETNRSYTVVSRYDIDAASTRLWLNPATESDPALDATDSQAAARIVAYGFREDTDIGGVFEVDDVKVGLTFQDVLASANPSAGRLAVRLEAGALVISWDTTAVLQDSASLGGPFLDVPGATSPFSAAPDAAARFFRLRR